MNFFLPLVVGNERISTARVKKKRTKKKKKRKKKRTVHPCNPPLSSNTCGCMLLSPEGPALCSRSRRKAGFESRASRSAPRPAAQTQNGRDRHSRRPPPHRPRARLRGAPTPDGRRRLTSSARRRQWEGAGCSRGVARGTTRARGSAAGRRRRRAHVPSPGCGDDV